jgi:hypothetical protein
VPIRKTDPPPPLPLPLPAGLFLFMAQPFRVGDRVSVGLLTSGPAAYNSQLQGPGQALAAAGVVGSPSGGGGGGGRPESPAGVGGGGAGAGLAAVPPGWFEGVCEKVDLRFTVLRWDHGAWGAEAPGFDPAGVPGGFFCGCWVLLSGCQQAASTAARALLVLQPGSALSPLLWPCRSGRRRLLVPNTAFVNREFMVSFTVTPSAAACLQLALDSCIAWQQRQRQRRVRGGVQAQAWPGSARVPC